MTNTPVARWDLVNEYPATVLTGEADIHFAEAVRRRTEGRVAIRPVADAASGLRTREQVQAVRDGRVAMANSFSGALAEESPAFLLSSLPFVTQSASDARALSEMARPLYQALFAERRQTVLFVSPWPPTGLWSARALDSVDTLRALRVRTYDQVSAEFFGRVAASARSVSFADLPPMLQSGEIDAVLSSGDGDAGVRLRRHLKHFTVITYAVPLSFGTVALDALGRLDARDRAAAEAAGRATTERQWAAVADRVARNLDAFRQAGVQVDEQPAPDVMATLRAATAPTIAAWRDAAGAEAGRVLDMHLRC